MRKELQVNPREAANVFYHREGESLMSNVAKGVGVVVVLGVLTGPVGLLAQPPQNTEVEPFLNERITIGDSEIVVVAYQPETGFNRLVHEADKRSWRYSNLIVHTVSGSLSFLARVEGGAYRSAFLYFGTYVKVVVKSEDDSVSGLDVLIGDESGEAMSDVPSISDPRKKTYHFLIPDRITGSGLTVVIGGSSPSRTTVPFRCRPTSVRGSAQCWGGSGPQESGLPGQSGPSVPDSGPPVAGEFVGIREIARCSCRLSRTHPQHRKDGVRSGAEAVLFRFAMAVTRWTSSESPRQPAASGFGCQAAIGV